MGSRSATVRLTQAQLQAFRRAAQQRAIATRWGGLSRAAQFGVRPYNQLRAAIRGTGLQAHHIIERRFGLNINRSVAVTRAEHQRFTNHWRRLLPYGRTYTPQQVWAAAQQVYRNFPVLLSTVRMEMWRYLN